MSTSVIHPNTIQIRPSRLTGLVVGVAILTGVTTWSVSQVSTDSHASSNPKPEVVSSPSAASKGTSMAWSRSTLSSELRPTETSTLRALVDGHPPRSEAIDTSPTAVTRDLVNRGLIPRQTLEPTPQSTDTQLQDLVNRG